MREPVPSTAPLSPSCRTRRAGFTLVELLVAMGVLVLLVTMISQLTTTAASTITASGQHMSADAQSRLIFDRLANDFERMVRRPDADFLCTLPATGGSASASSNGAMFFYSEVPAYFDAAPAAAQQSTAALIGYRINPTTYQLERLNKGLTWDNAVPSSTPSGIVYLTFPAGSTTPLAASTIAGAWPTSVVGSSPYYTDGTDPDYHPLGEQVFRLDVRYLLKSADATNGTLSRTPYLSTHSAVNGFQDVSAIVVSLAILDDASRRIVSNYSALAASLATPGEGSSAAQAWSATINAPAFAQTAGLPQKAASQVRVYERFFYLHNNF